MANSGNYGKPKQTLANLGKLPQFLTNPYRNPDEISRQGCRNLQSVLTQPSAYVRLAPMVMVQKMGTVKESRNS